MKLKDLEKRLKQEPDNLGLRVTVAGLMREAGRSTEAVELYRSVALAYRDQGRKNQAIAVCRSILEIAPDDVACNALLGQLTDAPAGPAARAPAISPPPTPQPAHTIEPASSRTATARESIPSVAPRAATPAANVGRSPTAPNLPRTSTGPNVPRSPTSPNLPRTSTGPNVPRTGTGPLSRTGSSPPRTGSAPPKTITIPPRAGTDAGTPPPVSSRPPTEAPPPPAAAARLPLEPPARRSSHTTGSPDVPKRRSSMEETPLPRPVPHHIYDPTGRANMIDLEELDTNPDPQRPRTPSGTGLAEAARKISGLFNRDDRRDERRDTQRDERRSTEDVAEPMDTRPVRRIRDEDLKKLAKAPPLTGEHSRLSEDDLDTKPQEAVTKPGGHDDDELTTPRELLDDEE